MGRVKLDKSGDSHGRGDHLICSLRTRQNGAAISWDTLQSAGSGLRRGSYVPLGVDPRHGGGGENLYSGANVYPGIQER